MKYKLLKNEWTENFDDVITHILLNRGFAPSEIPAYLNADDSCINDYDSLGLDNLVEGAKALIKTIKDDKKCIVVVDSDCDGYTSSALLINYLYDLFPAWVQNNLIWTLHSGKQHGLSDFDFNNIENLNLGLVICPDSASNDYEYHKRLKDIGINVLVLDHHEAEKVSEDAIIINNQLSDYPNKDLSGVGVTWQFCRYLDDLLHKEFSNKYLDLVALGNMADMMSMKSIETKYLINKGFEGNNILNPFIYGMWQKNNYKLGNKITPMGAAFYIAPFVNAMVRSGTQLEKELLFRSMLKFEAFKQILSNKRGHKLGEMERVLDQALRTCTNVKNRQSKAETASLELLEGQIVENNLLDHKVLLFLLEPGQIDRNIAGLVANKFMAKYQRPCCILTKVTEKLDYIELPAYPNEISIPLRLERKRIPCKPYTKVSYQGSARGYDKSGITNFKDICAAAPSTIYAEGHQGAFGFGIECGYLEEENGAEVYGEGILQFIDYTDEVLKDMESEPIYEVDYIFEGKAVNSQIILDIAKLSHLWGKDMDEPFIAIKGLKVTKDMVTLMSPDKTPTLKIQVGNISCIKFGSSQEEYEKLCSDGYYELDIVGRCNANEWNGHVSAQLMIEDYEIKDSSKYYF